VDRLYIVRYLHAMGRLYKVCHSLFVKTNIKPMVYARTNVIGSRNSFVVAYVRSSVH